MRNLCAVFLMICLASAASAHDHRAYPFVAPVVALPVPVVQQVPLDHLLAALETSEEARLLLANSERLNQLAADPLARQFLRERLTHRDVANAAGLSQDYLNWLFETLTAYGNRLDPALVIPNFRLYPSQNVASWPQIYARSFQPVPLAISVGPVVSVPWQARITTRHPHAHIHQSPDAGSRKVARPPTGSSVTVLAESGDWYMIRTPGGVVGYGHKYEMIAEQPGAVIGVPFAGSTVAWQPEGGRDTPYGWVYPHGTQIIETFSR